MIPIRIDLSPRTDLTPFTDRGSSAPEPAEGATPEGFPDLQAILAMFLATSTPAEPAAPPSAPAPKSDLSTLTGLPPRAPEPANSPTPERFPDLQVLLAMLLAVPTSAEPLTLPSAPAQQGVDVASEPESFDRSSSPTFPVFTSKISGEGERATSEENVPLPVIGQPDAILKPDGATATEQEMQTPARLGEQPLTERSETGSSIARAATPVTPRAPDPGTQGSSLPASPEVRRDGPAASDPDAAARLAMRIEEPAPRQEPGRLRPEVQTHADPSIAAQAPIAQAPIEGRSPTQLRSPKPPRVIPVNDRDAVAAPADHGEPFIGSPEGGRPERLAPHPPFEGGYPAPALLNEEPAPLLRSEPGLDSLDDRGSRGGTRPIQFAVEAPVRAGNPAAEDPSPVTAALSGQEIPAPVDQIVRTARILRQEGRTEMQVHLEPPALGWVRVSVRASHDALALNIDAERPETQALLSQALPDLQQALASRGLDVASLTIRLDHDVAQTRSGPDRATERPRRAEPRERVRARSGLSTADPLPRVDLTI